MMPATTEVELSLVSQVASGWLAIVWICAAALVCPVA